MKHPEPYFVTQANDDALGAGSFEPGDWRADARRGRLLNGQIVRLYNLNPGRGVESPFRISLNDGRWAGAAGKVRQYRSASSGGHDVAIVAENHARADVTHVQGERFAQVLNFNSSHNSCPKSCISRVFGCIYLHNVTYTGR